MAQSDPSAAPGRVRAAWYVLMGRRTTPLQIAAEWLEYKMTFDDILERFGARLAREAKNQKKAVADALTDAPPSREVATHVRPKDAVRARFAASRGITIHGGLVPQTSSNGVEDE